MKVLIVGLNYAPEPIGIGPYTAGLAEYLASRGHAVEVIAGWPSFLSGAFFPATKGSPGAMRATTGSVSRAAGTTFRECLVGPSASSTI